MNMFVKGIAASLMGVLMTGTAAQGAEVAVIETTLGNIELEFLEDVAPGHTKNFKDLANKGFYDGTIYIGWRVGHARAGGLCQPLFVGCVTDHYLCSRIACQYADAINGDFCSRYDAIN